MEIDVTGLAKALKRAAADLDRVKQQLEDMAKKQPAKKRSDFKKKIVKK